MRLSLRALVCTMVISCGALASLHAREPGTDPDRIPRTQGIEPDMPTRLELSAIVDRHAAAAAIPADFVRAVIRIERDWDASLAGYTGDNLCRTVLKYQAGHQAIKMTDATNAYCGRVRTIMASAN